MLLQQLKFLKFILLPVTIIVVLASFFYLIIRTQIVITAFSSLIEKYQKMYFLDPQKTENLAKQTVEVGKDFPEKINNSNLLRCSRYENNLLSYLWESDSCLLKITAPNQVEFHQNFSFTKEKPYPQYYIIDNYGFEKYIDFTNLEEILDIQKFSSVGDLWIFTTQDTAYYSLSKFQRIRKLTFDKEFQTITDLSINFAQTEVQIRGTNPENESYQTTWQIDKENGVLQ